VPQAQQQHTGAGVTSGGLRTASTQDWDAIFAGLEESKQQPPTTGAAPNGSNLSTTTIAGESGTNAGTGTDPVFTTTSASVDPGVSGYEEKLTKLTGMGFSRENSLKALEKFEYNVESATNYLIDN